MLEAAHLEVRRAEQVEQLRGVGREPRLQALDLGEHPADHVLRVARLEAQAGLADDGPGPVAVAGVGVVADLGHEIDGACALGARRVGREAPVHDPPEERDPVRVAVGAEGPGLVDRFGRAPEGEQRVGASFAALGVERESARGGGVVVLEHRDVVRADVEPLVALAQVQGVGAQGEEPREDLVGGLAGLERLEQRAVERVDGGVVLAPVERGLDGDERAVEIGLRRRADPAGEADGQHGQGAEHGRDLPEVTPPAQRVEREPLRRRLGGFALVGPVGFVVAHGSGPARGGATAP